MEAIMQAERVSTTDDRFVYSITFNGTRWDVDCWTNSNGSGIESENKWNKSYPAEQFSAAWAEFNRF